MDSFSQNVGRRGPRSAMPLEPIEDIGILYDVPFVIEAEMGRANRTVREVLKLAQGSLVELDKEEGSPIELRINGRLIAKGEVVEIDGNYGVRISELVYQ